MIVVFVVVVNILIGCVLVVLIWCLYLEGKWVRDGLEIIFGGKMVSKFFFWYFGKWVSSYLNFEEFKLSFFFPHILIGCVFIFIFFAHKKYLGNNSYFFVTITHEMY